MLKLNVFEDRICRCAVRCDLAFGGEVPTVIVGGLIVAELTIMP
jgi:hypothetical protein